MSAVNGSTTTPEELLASFRSEIDALADAEVLVPRVDVNAAALTAIGAMPEIEAQRAQIVSRFHDAGARTLDRLVPLAQLLMFVQAGFVAVAEADLEPMARALMEKRTALASAASALVERGIVAKKALPELVGGQSYQARVTDTFALIRFFRANASIVASHTWASESHLVAAYAAATEFGQAFARRDQARAGTTASARDRARVFTLFFRTYERVRRMLTFLRWHAGDVDRIAPSLYAGRRGRKSDDVAPPPVPTDPTHVVPPGLPGADPFRVT
jgi:hypothetical protein